MAQSTPGLAIGRVTSLAIAVVLLVLFGPLLGFITLAIKIESSAPLFFVQERLDRRGRRFGLVKFRTTDNFDRITLVGRWLRCYRLDELPQLFNVIRGDVDLSETGWKFGPL
jgi:lipopolysaccharide/colanic/teichoic acid biosynthesis glycosyltransferase